MGDFAMLHPINLANLIDTTRGAIAPVFLLTAISSLLLVMTGRLSRIVNRARELREKPANSLSTDQRTEFRLISRRIKLINRAILLSVMSALAVCLTIALLFVGSLFDGPVGVATAVELTFIVSMILLMGGLVDLVMEVRCALSILHAAENVLVESPGRAGEPYGLTVHETGKP